MLSDCSSALSGSVAVWQTSTLVCVGLALCCIYFSHKPAGMSDNAIVFLDLATSAAEASQRIAHLKTLLLNAKIIIANEYRDAMQPSEYLPGPRAIEAAPNFAIAHLRQRVNNGVDFVVARESYPQAESQPPPCPACGVAASVEEQLNVLNVWLAGNEPPWTCGACGKTTSAGDWVGAFACFVSELAVRFNNWPEHTPSFANNISLQLGPRSRIVYEHF
jgi:hypothetical protein